MSVLINTSYEVRFIMYLISIIREYVVTNVDMRQLTRWNDYFKENELEIDSYTALLLGINNLVYNNFLGGWIIKINPNIMLYNINVSDICNLITYGNLEVEPYPIIREAFEYVTINIDVIYDEYTNGEY